MVNRKLSAPSALLLAVLLLVPLWLFVPRPRHASPQEVQPTPPVPPVTGKMELDRGRSFFSSGIGPAENVVIYLESSTASPPPPLKGPLRIVQQSKRFDPPIIVVSPGSEVDFPNRDPIFHNVFSPYYGPAFDLGLYKPGDSKKVEFKVPGVSWIFCNIHQEMSAIVLTVTTPYFAVTDKRGNFSIPGVPDGTYRVKVWYDQVTPEELEKASRTAEIGPTTRQLPTLRLSTQGFVAIPHKNKFGKDYPPPDIDPYTGMPRT